MRYFYITIYILQYKSIKCNKKMQVMQTFFCSFNLPDCNPDRQVVKTYSSGSSFYRIYSDGWCEQGGSVVTTSVNPCPVQFLQQYSTTDYTVWTSHIDSAGQQNYYRCIKDKTTSGFSFWTWQKAGITTFWCACGYISTPVQNNIKQIIKY